MLCQVSTALREKPLADLTPDGPPVAVQLML